ncbi:hypothetical protein [Brevibacillus sp. SYSU BS000544]|uniref:hypothetical protein n=1 Tax=Brevibacillus sp. SYSU BS000544 TaxID=3416443 RepID=UPI003CE494DE
MDFVAISFDWISYIIDLIFVGLPICLITYWATKRSLMKKIRELEARINKIESKQ